MVRFEDWAQANLSGEATERDHQVWAGAAHSMHAACLDAVVTMPTSDASEEVDDPYMAYEEAIQECIDAIKGVELTGVSGGNPGEERAAPSALEVSVEQLQRWSQLLSEGDTAVAREEIVRRLRGVGHGPEVH